jgi:hypothetical protein
MIADRGLGWLAPALALAAGLALGACRRQEVSGAGAMSPTPGPSGAPAALPAGARRTADPAPFVHPQIEDPPAPTQETRAECASGALVRVAARILEAQKMALSATAPSRKAGRHSGCGSPPLAQLDGEVKGPLDDRVRVCVAQDGLFDAEWNSLSAALSSLVVCLDCGRTASERKASCLRALDVVNRAQADALAKSPPR